MNGKIGDPTLKPSLEITDDTLPVEPPPILVEWNLGANCVGLGNFDVDSCGCSCSCGGN